MLFDALPAESDQDGRLLHWFLRGGFLGILLLGSGFFFPSRWEHFYRLLCPATDSETAYDLGITLSPGGLIIWIAFILVSQFVIYGAVALGLGFVTGVIRNRSARQCNDPASHK